MIVGILVDIRSFTYLFKIKSNPYLYIYFFNCDTPLSSFFVTMVAEMGHKWLLYQLRSLHILLQGKCVYPKNDGFLSNDIPHCSFISPSPPPPLLPPLLPSSMCEFVFLSVGKKERYIFGIAYRYIYHLKHMLAYAYIFR